VSKKPVAIHIPVAFISHSNSVFRAHWRHFASESVELLLSDD
jgi:hypothetical protein